jgi:hypothetical protein
MSRSVTDKKGSSLAENIALCDAALENFQNGDSLEKSVDKAGLTRVSFWHIMAANPALLMKFDAAQKVRAEIVSEQVVSIADDESIDVVRARLMFDARKWYASKILPKKYGDKLDLNITAQIDIAGALHEAKARTLDACYRKVDAQEITNDNAELKDAKTDSTSVFEENLPTVDEILAR